MKKLKLIACISILVSFALSSCSHKVVRLGYEKPVLPKYPSCSVSVTKNKEAPSKSKKLGSVELKDSGFSTSCSELDAVQLLKIEACAINGNYVNITSEKESDFRSSCYRCTADIYLVENDSLLNQITTNSELNYENIQERAAASKKRNRGIFWTSFAVGFVIGFISVQ